MSHMSGDPSSEQLTPQLQSLAETVRELARGCQGNSLSLLALLRVLERLHGEIRDGAFQDSLPDNRQALYGLLRDIEATGGWPYIHRMKLQHLLKNFPIAEDGELAALFTPGVLPVINPLNTSSLSVNPLSPEENSGNAKAS